MASNVVPFRARGANENTDPAVPTFDPSNPAHVRAWRSMFEFARREYAKAQMADPSSRGPR